MGFKKGNKAGGSIPGNSHKKKEKVLEKWFEQFQKEGTTKKIQELYTSDFREYMRLFVQLLPREQKIDVAVNPFEGRTVEELKYYISHGAWPE